MTSSEFKLSLVIPVYNEAAHLKDVLNLLHSIQWPCAVEYVLVDDCSKDASWSIAQEYAKDHPMTLFRQPQNAGKGAALHKGFELASGNIIAVQDADFEYDPEDLLQLVKPIIANKADVVFGSRFRKTSPQVHRTFHYLVNRLLTIFSNVLSGLYLTDMETCYKVFRAEIIKGIALEAKRFGFEPEVTAKVAKLKIRVHEYPISYFPRTYQEGKKINWRDGVAAIWFIIKFNMRPHADPALKNVPDKYKLKSKAWL